MNQAQLHSENPTTRTSNLVSQLHQLCMPGRGLEMGELIRREFKSPGDVEQVKDWITFSSYFYFDISALLG